jgi:hypothetical protein
MALAVLVVLVMRLRSLFFMLVVVSGAMWLVMFCITMRFLRLFMLRHTFYSLL